MQFFIATLADFGLMTVAVVPVVKWGMGDFGTRVPEPEFRSRSIFYRLRVFLSLAPAPIKTRLSTIKFFFNNIPSSMLEKIHLFLCIIGSFCF